jgi:hypothetical protein
MAKAEDVNSPTGHSQPADPARESDVELQRGPKSKKTASAVVIRQTGLLSSHGR